MTYRFDCVIDCIWIAELRYPPEPESTSGFFASVFGGSSKKSGRVAVVNDADIHAAATQAMSRGVFPGSAASRAAEVHRRLQGGSKWLRLASSACSGDETAIVGHDPEAAAGASPTTVDLARTSDWSTVDLSRTLMDLVSLATFRRFILALMYC